LVLGVGILCVAGFSAVAERRRLLRYEEHAVVGQSRSDGDDVVLVIPISG
jgi:hypothetical protein